MAGTKRKQVARLPCFVELYALCMRIFIRAKANAKTDEIEKVDPTHFRISVKEPPIDGRANKAIERAVADYFDVPPSSVRVVSGHGSKQKVVEMS